MPEFNTMELMVVVASRILENGATVGVGTGAPLAASMLAHKMHAPDLVIMFEAGGIAPVLCKMPISV
jgi:glutaconate CoA-transferase, subunit B